MGVDGLIQLYIVRYPVSRRGPQGRIDAQTLCVSRLVSEHPAWPRMVFYWYCLGIGVDLVLWGVGPGIIIHVNGTVGKDGEDKVFGSLPPTTSCLSLSCTRRCPLVGMVRHRSGRLHPKLEC